MHEILPRSLTWKCKTIFPPVRIIVTGGKDVCIYTYTVSRSLVILGFRGKVILSPSSPPTEQRVTDYSLVTSIWDCEFLRVWKTWQDSLATPFNFETRMSFRGWYKTAGVTNEDNMQFMNDCKIHITHGYSPLHKPEGWVQGAAL